jgi:glucose/arabinose dehydrogenase
MKRIYLLLILACGFISAQAQTFSIRTVKNNIFIPWEIIYGPDDNIWFTQKNGYICRMDPVNGATDTLYHETNNVIQNEGGMLGMALHPGFPATPYIYVAYEYNNGNYRERIVRYTYYPTGDTLGTPTILLDDIVGANIHNGCRLTIVNDKLFITTGDAGNTSNPQDLSSINGKVLRINLDGTIPSDNPIGGSPVWSWGHRNAQGMVYANNKLYNSMHGLNSDDEINIIEVGRNYGWPDVQGYCDQPGEMTFCTDSNVVEPIYAWTPTIAASGMDYYNHPMFPQWQNALAMTSLKDESLWILKLDANFDSVIAAIRIDTLNIGRIRDICISPNGSIFLSTSNSQSNASNKIDRIVELVDSSFIPVKVPVSVMNNTIQVYPNPTRDIVTVSIKNVAVAGMKYSIINSVGQEVAQGKISDRTISLRNLPVGLYQLRLTGPKGAVYMGKILKE